MRPAHRKPAIQAGFTLLELLIVMIIIGLAAAMVGPRITAAMESGEHRQVRDALLFRLSRLRTQAVVTNRPQTAQIDVDAGTLQSPTERWTLPENWRFELLPPEPDPTAVPGMGDELAEVLDASSLILQFHADGSARRARFRLLGPGQYALLVSLTPLTGRINLLETEPDDVAP